MTKSSLMSSSDNTVANISKASLNDLEEILALQKLAFVSEAELYNNYDIAPLKQTLESIREDFKTNLFLKAVYNQKIIGSVKGFLTDDTCWIGKLIVHPDYQNKGLGRKLMNEIEKCFANVRSFSLFTGERSEKNIYLYESLGYKKKEIFSDEKLPDVHLVKLVKENQLMSST